MLIRSDPRNLMSLFALMALTVLLGGKDGERTQTPRQATIAETCDWTLVDSVPLTAPGAGHLFIDVTRVIDAGSERAIVGPQALVWDASDPALPPLRGSAIGLIHRDNGEATLIPAPEEFDQVSTVNGTRLSDGRWLLIWIEALAPDSFGFRRATSVWQGVFDGAEWEGVKRIPMETDPGDLDETRLRVFEHNTRVYSIMRGPQDGSASGFLLVLERDPDGIWSERRVQIGYSPAFAVAPPFIAFTHNEWPPGATLPNGAVSTFDVTAEEITVTRQAVMQSQNPSITLAVRTPPSGREYLWHSLPSTSVGPVLQGVAEGRTKPDSVTSLGEYAAMPGGVLVNDLYPFLWFRPMPSEPNGSGTSFDLIAIRHLGELPTVLRTGLDTPFLSQFANPGLLDDEGRTYLFGGVENAGQLITVMLVGQLACS